MTELHPATRIELKRARMSPEAGMFYDSFSLNRAINREYFQRVPENKFDYRMVDTPEIKSDSPRESLEHQIYVTKKYLYGITHGSLEFDGKVDSPIEKKLLKKEDLIHEFDKTTDEIADALLDPMQMAKHVSVPWSKEPVPALDVLYGLNQHEVLHTGWNLAVMDHLGIERFPLLKQAWG